MRLRTIAALAVALCLEKLLLLAALAVAHGVPIGAGEAARALLPEAALGTLLVAAAGLAPSAAARRAVGAVALALVLATWLAVAAWAYAGTVVSWELFTRLFESPQAIATAVRAQDGPAAIATSLLALGAALALARLVVRGLAGRVRAGRAAAPPRRAWAGLALGGALALAATIASGSDPLVRPVVAAALGAEPQPSIAAGAIDPALARELAPRAAAPSRPAVPGVRNVVIVVLESVRHDPDSALARGFPDALHFDRVYAHHPRSVKTLEALLFGIYPSPWRATAAWEIDRYDVDAIGALPAVLGRAGFASSYLGSMNLMFDGYGRALERAGFDRVERASGGRELTWGIAADPLLEQVAGIVEAGRREGVPQLVTAWTTECHRPYDFAASESESAGETAGESGSPRERYRACVDALAGALARFRDRLRATGADRDTLVVALGDHGQTFAEEHPELAFAQHVHEPSLRVPVLLFLPTLGDGAGVRPAAQSRDDRLFQIVDVPRTILGALALQVPPAWVGRDMLDPREPGRDLAFVVSILDSAVLGAIERGGRKTVRARDGRLLAYDLTADPGEASPRELAGEDAASVRARLDGYVVAAASGWEARARAPGETAIFRGADLLGFGRAGPCLDARLAGDHLALAPREQGDCAPGATARRGGAGGERRRHALLRRIAERAAAVRVALRLRLDGDPPPGAPPRVKARIGRRGAWSTIDLRPVAGVWQDVALTVVPPRAARSASGAKRARRGGAGLELVVVDPSQACAIESIALELVPAPP